jgi:hypothetical protein
VEQNIRAREIGNEISVETKSQSIQTASKSVADALIKTTEDGPTDLQDTRITAIVSAQLQAAKKEAAKKEKGRQHEGHYQPTLYQPKAQHKKKKGNWEAHSQQNASWSCPSGYPPASTNDTPSEYPAQQWQTPNNQMWTSVQYT